VIELPITIDRKGAPTRETHHEKVDHDDSVAGPSRHFGGDGADARWFAKSRRTSIDEFGPAIAAGCSTGRPRQPRADQVPSEKNLMDPNDPINQENAALDRMINGICRGC
jgi:hypothetical protein